MELGAGNDSVVVPNLLRDVVVHGGGADTAEASLVDGSPVGSLATYDVEAVFLNDGRTGAGYAWELNGIGLQTSEDTTVLETTNAVTSHIRLSEGSDQITVSYVENETHINTRGGIDAARVGLPDTGGQLDTIVHWPLFLDGGAGDDTLTLDDTSRPAPTIGQDATSGTFATRMLSPV